MIPFIFTFCYKKLFFISKKAKNHKSEYIYVYLYIINNLLFIKVKNGTVKFFNESKGFGFVTESESNTEYFVHVSGLIDEIREGDAVEFDLKEGRKGLNAVDVRVI